MMRFRMDVDGLKLRSESLHGLRDEVLCAVDRRLEKELARPNMPLEQPVPDVQRGRDLLRRVEDTEARVSALRVRVDSHDSRFNSIAERAEAVCQQAVESVRQTAAQHRDEILSEADSQLRILRQRVEALSELCEELMLRQTPRGTAGWRHRCRNGLSVLPPRWKADLLADGEQTVVRPPSACNRVPKLKN